MTVGIRSTKEELSAGYPSWGRNDKRTLGIKEDGVFHEVWPLEHTPQFLNVFLSVGSHCMNQLLTHNNSISLIPTPTLLVVTHKHHLPQGRLISSQHRQVIPNFNLTRFVDNNGLDRDQLCEPAIHDPIRRQHADCAENNSRSQYQTLVAYCIWVELS